jgi:hypothetical protein
MPSLKPAAAKSQLAQVSVLVGSVVPAAGWTVTFMEPVTSISSGSMTWMSVAIAVPAASAGPPRSMTLPTPQPGKTSRYGHAPSSKPSTERVNASPAI